MPDHEWEHLVEQIEQERNPIKVVELAQKLDEAMLAEEREKVRSRLAKPPVNVGGTFKHAAETSSSLRVS